MENYVQKIIKGLA